MSINDSFTVIIKKIHSVQEFKHVVLVDMDTSCYAPTYHNKVLFRKSVWQRVRAEMKYNDRETCGDENSLKYYEEMSEEDFHKRFERTLSEYTDEEIVAEINRRAYHPFHDIQFKVEAIIKKR